MKFTEDELESIERKASDVGFDFNCGLACITSAASMWVTLALSPSSQPSQSRTVISALIPMLLIAGLIFGIRWYKNRGEMKRIFEKIRARQVGPLGDETHELRARDLVSIPLESAPSPTPLPAATQSTPAAVVTETVGSSVTTSEVQSERE